MKKLLLSLLLILPFFLSGCDSKKDEKVPAAEVKTQDKTIHLEKLKKMALGYKEAIEEKMAGVKKIEEQLKSCSPKDLLGDKAKKLKDKIIEHTNSINALQKNLEEVLSELKSKGEDTTDL